MNFLLFLVRVGRFQSLKIVLCQNLLDFKAKCVILLIVLKVFCRKEVFK